MQILVNTDHNIKAHETTIASVTDVVENAVGRFTDRITRVEVHLSDENSNKKDGDDDIRCVMEVRLEGRPPDVVTHNAASVDEAVDGAAEKLTRMIDSTLERLRDNSRGKGAVPVPDLPDDVLLGDTPEA